MSKPGYHHGDLPSALIASALALVEDVGVQGLTLRAVARHAGVSHAAPYNHYADRQALLGAVAEQGFADLTERMDSAWASNRRRPFGDRLTATAAAYVTFATERPAHFRIMFAPPVLTAAADRAFGVLHAAIVQGQDAGAFARDADARELAVAAWSACHGLAFLAIDGRLASASGRTAQAADLVPQVLRWIGAGFGVRTA